MPNRTLEKVRIPAAVEGFFKQLLVTYKGVIFYPSSSTFPRESGDAAAEQLREILSERSEVKLFVAKDHLLYDDIVVFPGQDAFSALAQEFYNRGVAEVRFHVGTRGLEIVSFFGLFRSSPAEIASAGGFEARLWDQGVTSISVTEARVHVVEEIAREHLQSGVDVGEIDRVLKDHAAGKPVERKVLVRVVSDSVAVTSYLAESLSSLDKTAAAGVRELAHIAAQQPLSDRSGMFRSIADALNGLEAGALGSLMVEHILPEARADDAMATIVRQFDIDDMCRMLVEEVAGNRVTREGVARAVRNLALVSMSERAEVMDAAGAAMRGAGLSEDDVNAILEEAAPSRVIVGEAGAAGSGARPVETVFHLLDLAPTHTWSAKDDPDLTALEREARQGVADGDILGALVTLVTVQPDTERWATIMAMLEDSLELLVARGEFEIASDAAEALSLAAAATAFSVIQRTRLAAAIGLLARPEDVRALTGALRVFGPDTDTHQAALRLLGLLSDRAVGPLLELLADEPDMAARKALVDLLSALAGNHITEVAKRVTDQRWYFVRNVVSVLGSTKNPAILKYLMHTVRHADARVRRESIRALAGLTDRDASNLLVSALGDEDPQNVQLASRYLGAARVRGAVPALVQVARGEGRGSREMPPRVEAVEALGRIASPEALTVLAELASRRGIVGVKANREVRVAAQAAVARVKAGV